VIGWEEAVKGIVTSLVARGRAIIYGGSNVVGNTLLCWKWVVLVVLQS
jgi:hypothetical protein